MINGKSIKLARESRGLSQSKLSELLGVTQATLSRFEKGVLTVAPEFVSKIVQALNYPASFFEKDIRIAGETSLFYRKRASMTVRDLSILESKISILSKSIDEMLESINIPELRIPSVEPTVDNSPQEIAYKIRNYLGVPAGPIDNIVSFKVISKIKVSSQKLIEDNTEEITKKVREYISKYSKSGKRLMQSFPNIKILKERFKVKRKNNIDK